jgi:hypothetical protein
VSEVCIPIGNSEVLLTVVYKSPGRAWSNGDITEILSFRHMSILASDLYAKHPFWNSTVSEPSGEKQLGLFDINAVGMSAPECPTHCSHTGKCDVLDIVVHQNISCQISLFLTSWIQTIYQ